MYKITFCDVFFFSNIVIINCMWNMALQDPVLKRSKRADDLDSLKMGTETDFLAKTVAYSHTLYFEIFVVQSIHFDIACHKMIIK